jgi:hypothetical protein
MQLLARATDARLCAGARMCALDSLVLQSECDAAAQAALPKALLACLQVRVGEEVLRFHRLPRHTLQPDYSWLAQMGEGAGEEDRDVAIHATNLSGAWILRRWAEAAYAAELHGGPLLQLLFVCCDNG